MNFILKIVEGPNKGAEAALVSGVAVTLGKGDDCDIVLADSTMPGNPVTIEASDDGVTVDGVALAQFNVKTVGATSFAVGPADSPWEDLVWPESDAGRKSKDLAEEPPAEKQPADAAGEGEKAVEAASGEGAPVEAAPEEPPRRRGRGCIGCLVAVLLVVLFAAGLAWVFRERARPHAAGLWGRMSCHGSSSALAEGGDAVKGRTLEAIAAKHGLSLVESDGVVTLSGNLKTRRERLLATAEAYETRPGVSLDLSDDESFRSSAEDALFTMTEGALKVSVATNRVLSVTGAMPSVASLRKILESLNSDLPKLRSVDVSGVRIGGIAVRAATSGSAEVPAYMADGDTSQTASQPAAGVPRLAAKKKDAPPPPVCGILTAPYPCLVMRDGRRVMEGAMLGDGVILKIEADSVTVTNSAGRFTWKP